jgi:hypothetical protein
LKTRKENIMVATSRIAMTDISRQKRFEVTLDGQLTPRHSVGQAIDLYLDRMGIRNADLRWSAFAGGVRLDNKAELAEVADAPDVSWTIMPEVSAG